MGNLVFQATLGGQVNLVGPNTASTFNLNVPAVSSTISTTSGTETLTNKTLTTPVINGFTGDTSVVNIGSGQFYKDTSGNIGVGVTPSAWSLGKVIELGYSGNGIAGADATSVYYSQNAYFNGTNWIYGSTNAASYYRQTSGQHRWYYAASGTAGTTATFTQAMTLDASGRLGIGQTSPSAKLDILNGAIRLTNDYDIGWGDGTTFIAGNGTSDVLFFYTNNTEKARIDSSGQFLVGTTDASGSSGVGAKIVSTGGGMTFAQVTAQTTNANGTAYNYYSTGAGAYRFYVGAGGTVFATSTSISAISDIRFKENVRDLDAGLAEVLALKPRLYDWKEGKGVDIKNARGFIAQEFEEVFPDLIDEWRDPAPEGEEPYKSVRQDLIPVLVKAIQELNAKFEAYKASHP